jgi:S1-C subfamily serine protease
LFNERGELMGLTTIGSVRADAQNLNFAVPADWIADVPRRHTAIQAALAAQAAAAAPAASAPATAPATAPTMQVPAKPTRRTSP